MKTKAVKVHFTAACQSTDYGMISIPAGLRVRKITTGGTRGNYFVDEFPPELFPYNSMIRHDAVHYGIILTPDQVTEGEDFTDYEDLAKQYQAV